MKIKAIIIEDEKSDGNSLKRLLDESCPSVDLIGEQKSIRGAINFIKLNPVDLVFLDIHLPRENGFELFTYFPEPKFKTIFTTACSQYALKELPIPSLDYLLKPINKVALLSAIQRVSERLAYKNVLEEMAKLKQALASTSQRLPLPTTNGFVYTEIKEIMYCEANRNYTLFYMMDGTRHMVSKNLKTYEDVLTNADFVRVSRSYIVNLNFIKSFRRTKGGEIIMKDDKCISVSSCLKSGLLEKLHA